MRDVKIEYERLVIEGKRLVEVFENGKIKLIELCLKVCELEGKHGGVRGGGVYTIKKFNDDIGFKNYETLRKWVQNYRKIVNKVPKEMIDMKRPEVLFRAAKDLNLKTPKEEVIKRYKQELIKTKEDHNLSQYLMYAKSMDFFISKSVILKALDQEELEKLRAHVNSTKNALDAHFNNSKAKSVILRKTKQKAEYK